jgi:Zn-dependent protease
MADAVVRFMDASPGIAVVFLYGVVTAVPVVFIHELGHAVAARVLLDADVDLSVGSTGRIAELRLGRITAQIHALSLRRSAGEVTFGAARATARDVLLVALAGPLASLAGTVVCALLLSAAPTSGLTHDLLWCSVSGGVFGVLNLLPFTLRDGSGAIQSDGRVAFDALRVVRQLS